MEQRDVPTLTSEDAREAAEPGTTQVLIPEVRHETRRRRLRWGAAVALPAILLAITLVLLQANHGARSHGHAGGSFPRTASLASACQGPTTALPTRAVHARPLRAFTPGSITAKLVLCQTSVVAGDPLPAVVLFDNHTHRTLAMHECPNQWLNAGIVGKGLSSVPAVALDLCTSGGPPYIPPGRWSLSTQIPTVSSVCDAGSTATQDGIPPCTAVGAWLPSLPRGRYQTFLQILGVPLPSSVLPSQPVTLVACRPAHDCSCAPIGDRPLGGRWVPFC